MSKFIVVKNISFSISNKLILDDINFEIPSNKLTAIVGPNGAGKSFLLKILTGLETPSKGAVLINGTNSTSFSNDELASNLCWNPANFDIPFNYRAKEICLMSRFPRHKGRPAAADHELVSKSFFDLGIENLIDRQVQTLSSGETKKVFLARALASGCPGILLDEPLANLDIHAKAESLKTLKDITSQGRTIAVVLHDINLAFRFADHVVILNKGKVFSAGVPGDVLTPQNIKSVFKVSSEVIKTKGGGDQLVTF